jgi:hypothetical protein
VKRALRHNELVVSVKAGGSSTPRPFEFIIDISEYQVARPSRAMAAVWPANAWM